MNAAFDFLETTQLGDTETYESGIQERRARLMRRDLPAFLHDHRVGARHYQASLELTTAANTALALGMPLLVTGEPGTGKTQVAWFLAEAFGLGTPLVLPIRSTTLHRDALYEFDAVAYFHAAHDPARQGQRLERSDFIRPGVLWQALVSAAPRVVLLDEIDKASRDFPNDLLHVLDQGWFPVHELDVASDTPDPARLPGLQRDEDGFAVHPPKDAQPPIIVITSNSEKRLPEPFLRRCIFHQIVLDEALVRRAIQARFPALPEGLSDRALRVFRQLRQMDLRKPPSTAELLAWIYLVSQTQTPLDQLDSISPALPFVHALLKDAGDLAMLRG